jgi:MaoC like domain
MPDSDYRISTLSQFVGQELGVSEWITIDQERINHFASFTGDRQWIHVDVERAKRESLIATQERTNQYIQDFFNEGIEMLKAQGESMRALLEELEQQIRKQYEALQALMYAPVGTALNILSTPLAAYQKALGIAETITRQGLEQMQQATQQTQERHSE